MGWADLPEELLNSIVSRDTNKEIRDLKCKSVCKSWEAIASRLRYPPHSFPCLMYYEKDSDRWNLFKNNDTSSAKIPEFADAEVLYSKDGWLLMSRDAHGEEFFIFKLEDKQILQIPEPDEIYEIISFVNQPGSSDCLIVGITASPSFTPEVYIGLLKWGEAKWNHYKHKSIQFELSDCAPILRRGLLYYLDTEGNIGTFDIEKPTEWTAYDECLEPADLRKEIKQIYFAKLEQEGEENEEAFFAVFLTHDERNVNVYKLLEPDMKWKRVASLGDKILFVGRGVSFGGKALFKSMANRIYFPIKESFYCLDTQQYLPFDGECNFPHHKRDGFKYFNHATWIDNPPPNFLELFK